MTDPSLAAWFPLLREKRDAQLRLVCLPYAGGSARIFRDWPGKLSVDICAVQPPGRENRLIEPPFTSASLFATALADQLDKLRPMPTVLFGHSMGALLAFETACELERRSADGLMGLIVSSSNAPQLQNVEERLSELDDQALIEHIRELDGTPEEVLGNADLMHLCLPTIRADFSLCESYRMGGGAKPVVRAPIYALGASGDDMVPAHGIEAWRMRAGGSFRSLLVEGDHFFIDRRPGEFLACINQFLRVCLIHWQTSAPTGNTRKDTWTTAS